MLFAYMVKHTIDMTAEAVTVLAQEAAVAGPGFSMPLGRKELYVRGGVLDGPG